MPPTALLTKIKYSEFFALCMAQWCKCMLDAATAKFVCNSGAAITSAKRSPVIPFNGPLLLLRCVHETNVPQAVAQISDMLVA